jgi:hypothetical protein
MKFRNFSIVPDEVVKKCGPVAGIALGLVYRYSQGDQHACTASQQRLANEIGVNVTTMGIALMNLEEHGYVTVFRTAGKTSIYRVSNKMFELSVDLMEIPSGKEDTPPKIHEHLMENPLTPPAKSMSNNIFNNKENSINTAPDFRKLTPVQYLKVPEIAFYQSVTGRDPGTEQCYVIYEKLHGVNLDFKKMQQAWREWVSRGYKSSNLAWIDWGLAGAIPDRDGNYPRGADPGKKAEWEETMKAAEERQAEEVKQKKVDAQRWLKEHPEHNNPMLEMANLAKEKRI